MAKSDDCKPFTVWSVCCGPLTLTFSPLEITLIDSDLYQDDPIQTKTFDLSNLEMGKTHTETFFFHEVWQKDVKILHIPLLIRIISTGWPFQLYKLLSIDMSSVRCFEALLAWKCSKPCWELLQLDSAQLDSISTHPTYINRRAERHHGWTLRQPESPRTRLPVITRKSPIQLSTWKDGNHCFPLLQTKPSSGLFFQEKNCLLLETSLYAVKN